MKKRGQASIFIVVGLIILIVASLTYVISKDIILSKLSQEPAVFSARAEPIRTHIQSCLEDTSKSAIGLIGLQGGNIEVSREEGLHVVIRDFYEDGKNTVLPLRLLEKNFDQFLVDNFPLCIKDEVIGYSLKKGKLTVDSNFKENEIIVNANYDIKAIREDVEISYKEFEYQVPVRIGYLHNIINEVVNEQVREPDLIHFSTLTSYDVNFLVMPLDEANYIIGVQDDKSKLDDKSYTFMFGMR